MVRKFKRYNKSILLKIRKRKAFNAKRIEEEFVF